MGKSNHEELLGGAPEATSNKQTVEDNLLGLSLIHILSRAAAGWFFRWNGKRMHSPLW